jgi:hypothetical protein
MLVWAENSAPDSEPDELEKTGVDDGTLVVRAAAVVDLERFTAVRCSVLRGAHVIRLRRQRSGSRDGPEVERFRPRICRSAIPDSRLAVAVSIGDRGGADQAGYFGGNRRR